MTTPLTYLAGTLVLALFQLFLTAGLKRQQDGLDWAMGNRDEAKSYTGAAARMARAQANLMETLPLFAAAVLLAHVAGREGPLVTWGAGLFFWGRLLYVPAYAAGLVPWRSFIWGVAIVGLVLVLVGLT